MWWMITAGAFFAARAGQGLLQKARGGRISSAGRNRRDDYPRWPSGTVLAFQWLPPTLAF